MNFEPSTAELGFWDGAPKLRFKRRQHDAWNEEDHPREAAGSPEGGQFTSAEGAWGGGEGHFPLPQLKRDMAQALKLASQQQTQLGKQRFLKQAERISKQIEAHPEFKSGAAPARKKGEPEFTKQLHSGKEVQAELQAASKKQGGAWVAHVMPFGGEAKFYRFANTSSIPDHFVEGSRHHGVWIDGEKRDFTEAQIVRERRRGFSADR